MSRSKTQRKAIIVEAMGGCCQMCGKIKALSQMTFHHIDPETKEFTIGNDIDMPWFKMIPELLKCVMLCRKCHDRVDYAGEPLPEHYNKFNRLYIASDCSNLLTLKRPDVPR